MYMAKNLFFFDIKNNAIVESNVDDVSKLNNSDIIQINYDSKNPNNKKNLIENIQRIINNYNLDNKNKLELITFNYFFNSIYLIIVINDNCQYDLKKYLFYCSQVLLNCCLCL